MGSQPQCLQAAHRHYGCYAGLGQKKPAKYVPSFLPPALAAAMNAQSNPHTGAAAAAAAISSRLSGVSVLGSMPVLSSSLDTLTVQSAVWQLPACACVPVVG